MQDGVLYSGDRCLGGGVIEHVGPSIHECRTGRIEFAHFRKDSELWQRMAFAFGDDVIAFPEDYWSIERNATRARTDLNVRRELKRKGAIEDARKRPENRFLLDSCPVWRTSWRVSIVTSEKKWKEPRAEVLSCKFLTRPRSPLLISWQALKSLTI